MSDLPNRVSTMPTRAMVLAAGFGTRLHPLTHVLPKPLVPVATVPLIRYSLRLLKQFHFEEVMINLHHLPDTVEAELGRKAEGLSLKYSREPSILGTGGGIRKVASFFPETFVVINSDAIIDLDIEAAVATHQANDALATMVVMERPKGCQYSVVGVDDNQRVRQIADFVDYQGPELNPYLFTGVHILEPEFLDYIPPDIESCINSYAYPKVLADDRVVAAHVHQGLWADVGTIDRYWKINADLLRRRVHLRNFDPLAEFAHAPTKDIDDVIRLGEKCLLGSGVHLEPPVIVANGARIADDATVGPEVVVGAGASIGKKARVSQSILLPGAKIEAGATVRSEIVTKKFRVPLVTEDNKPSK